MRGEKLMTSGAASFEAGRGESAHGKTCVFLDGFSLTIKDIVAVARGGARVELSGDAGVRMAVDISRQLLVDEIGRGTALYGITTGFGDSAHRHVPAGAALRLQENLIRFLGCGTGAMATAETVRAVMLVRANTLARGHSGVRIELIEQLVNFLNHHITPQIPEEGSVGASGDLVPLSYVAAALTGERDVIYREEIQPAAKALVSAGLAPLTLEPKEALALVNGTAFMTGLAVLALADAQRLAVFSDVNTAMAVEVLHGLVDPFDEFVHDTAKPHPGQVQSAARVRNLLRSSQFVSRSRVNPTRKASGYIELPRAVQDKYSIRCAPQFTGVLWDTISWASDWLTIEVNSSNDNPLVDPVTGRVLGAGNFSGGHVALAMDALRTAVASVADLMDRQVALVVDEKFNGGLTPNLVARLPAEDPDAGLHHGFKGMQLACSSLTAEALSLTMPLGSFSRSTECHNQDKVSMGTTAARRTRDVVALTEKVAIIQLLALCQAADLRGSNGLGETRLVHDRVRRVAPEVSRDREMDVDITHVLRLLHDGVLLDGVSDAPLRKD
ncbi:histidine ammonia-lyase [Streptomyces sp. NPDC086783]|uniref:HAL/PAL/TAL family ammonia-lyase n=1 Tax=Streptomyces sp. NPDC086783 TaxID=3365758 RepID=UPI003804566F